MTRYSHLADERFAARFLGLTISKLRALRARGRGPRSFTLPTGEVRYEIEALEAWAFSGGTVIRSPYTDNLLPFPGVRIRTILADEKPARVRRHRLRRKYLDEDELA